MHVPEIIEVKSHLQTMQDKGLLEAWELPYENILTRRSAAIFFLTPSSPSAEENVWDELKKYDHFNYRTNEEKKLSQLKYRVTFST